MRLNQIPKISKKRSIKKQYQKKEVLKVLKKEKIEFQNRISMGQKQIIQPTQIANRRKIKIIVTSYRKNQQK